jgi:hypothetical protein
MRMSESNIGSLLVFAIQPLEESLIVEMNIEQESTFRQVNCCGAAKYKTHGDRKE